MFQATKPALLTLFVLLTLFQTGTNGIRAQESIPDTPVGKCFAELLDTINNDDDAERLKFLKEGFAKNDDATVKQRMTQTDQLRSMLGKLELIKVISSSESSIAALLKSADGPNVELMITTSDDAPSKIGRIELQMAGDDGGTETTSAPLDTESRKETIERLAKELRSKYVYPEVGEKMALAVEKALADGDYAKIFDVGDFASLLSDQLREICNDKHLRVRAGSPRPPANSPGRRSVDNHGFVKAEVLPGGIGYLKFNFFSGDQEAKNTAAAAMNFLANSKALIFDLRENGGGSPEMIAFLSSYLFDEPVHLNSFYNRPSETTTESWTEKEVQGPKFSQDTPVFVLTSSYTFSGAEEFSYNLKNLKRGTIVGETTGGGAHPVMPVPLGKHLHITMPFARAINPITKTNWEGVGVIPDVAIDSEQALEKAIELARIANDDSKTEATKKEDDSEGNDD